MQIPLDFSIYDLVDLTRHNNIFITQTHHMRSLSRLIEADILRFKLDVNMYVGLQRLSNLNPIQDVYRRLAEVVDNVFVFGVADVQPMLHKRLTILSVADEARIAREWFVIVSHKHYARALVAREPHEARGQYTGQRFQGVLINDADVVATLAERVYRRINPGSNQAM